MSESDPSRIDAVDPERDPSSLGPGGELMPAGESALTAPATMEQMAERLRFYESFDELIQQNIARSGELLREAAGRRDEAVAAIAESRQAIEADREAQRAILAELLDDVMTIQQATERLAHRISDTLEQIEFELEPVGLRSTLTLGEESQARPAGRLASLPVGGQSVAEDVHDEYRHGVIGQRPATSTSPRGIDGSERLDTRSSIDAPAIPHPDERAASSSPDNPETSAVPGDESGQHDFASPTAQLLSEGEIDPREPAVGEGPEATPLEASADGWSSLGPEPVVLSNSDEASAGEPPLVVQRTVLPSRTSELHGSPNGATLQAATPDDPGIQSVPPVEPELEPAEGLARSVERQTTIVLEGVPRAAVALSIQRHLLAKPDVLRAEVREYYDRRLTLFVTALRPTTSDDLKDWHGAGAWEHVESSPERLELRMVT